MTREDAQELQDIVNGIETATKQLVTQEHYLKEAQNNLAKLKSELRVCLSKMIQEEKKSLE